MVMPNLPPELIVDILSKLPVKSLMRFKCVSKSFRALIADRRFVKMHLKTQRERPLFFYRPSLRIADLKETSSGGHELQVVELDYKPIKPKLRRVRFFGSCDGMLCVIPLPVTSYSSHDVYVYNASTRESKQLPDYQPETHPMTSLSGFGYAPACDDYKFVKIFWKKRVMIVFSLKNNYWKTVEIDLDANLSPELRLTSSYFNGAIHWVFRNKVIGSRMIAAFDLVEEKFNYLTLPPRLHGRGYVFTFLEVFGDYLGIIGHSCNGNIEVWLMREYGVKESWDLKFSTDRRFYWLSSLGNNKLLLSLNESELLLWDLKEGTGKNLNDGTCNVVKTRLQDLARLKDWYKPIVIVESIVSPNYNYTDFTINGGLF